MPLEYINETASRHTAAQPILSMLSAIKGPMTVQPSIRGNTRYDLVCVGDEDQNRECDEENAPRTQFHLNFSISVNAAPCKLPLDRSGFPAVYPKKNFIFTLEP